MALRYISPNELLVAGKRQQKEGMQYTIWTYAGFRGRGGGNKPESEKQRGLFQCATTHPILACRAASQ